MPAKDRYPEITEALKNAVEKLDMDGVLYKLAEIARDKRDEAEGVNPAEYSYQKQMQRLLSDAAEKANEIDG